MRDRRLDVGSNGAKDGGDGARSIARAIIGAGLEEAKYTLRPVAVPHRAVLPAALALHAGA